MGTASTDASIDDWVLKQGDLSLPRTMLEDTLQARGFPADTAHDQTFKALLQELYLRESLLKQVDKVSPEQLKLLDKQVEDYRRGQLSRLVLDDLAKDGMPDYEQRAKELYEARKDTDYALPLRLRVRVIEKSGMDEASAKATLEQVRSQIQAGTLDFGQAVQEYSDAEDKRLTQGDTFWFHKGQKAPVFYTEAAGLSSEQPLSAVFVYQGRAYLLQFIGRQEAMVQTYPEVKAAILAELQNEYQQQQRKLILEGMRTRFQENVEIHPDFQ